ncbi:putative lipoprotein [Hyalangium minutum]|uniref:Putative lipoprotein n=1 Tax=Hyalangium minutum TaxID=394096 RepID=A0A085WHK8_9BACT|nr:putative lipoprotein [Hyalangium minutum]
MEPLNPNQVDAWLREGLFHKLLGTLIPDVVVHAAGDLLNIQAVFDFKFPCPKDKEASWHEYHPNHPFHPLNQQTVYEEAFKAEVMSVRPAFGVTR